MITADPPAPVEPGVLEADGGKAWLPRAGFAAAIVIVVGVAALSVIKLHDLAAEARWVAHTHQAIRTLTRLQAAIVDAETGARGFVITGEDSFLEPYGNALSDVAVGLTQLDQLVADNPDQHRRLDDLRLRIIRQLDNFVFEIGLVERGQRAAAARAIASGRGREMMEAVRAGIHDMLAVEETLLAKRSESAREGAAVARVLVIGGGVAGIALLALAYLALRRESAHHAVTAAAARDAKAFLDQLIEAIPHIVYVKSVDGLRYVSVNRAHEEMFGIPRRDLLGKSDSELFATEEARIIAEEDRIALAGSGVCEFEVDQFVSARRGVRTLHKKKVVIPNARGEPRYLLGVADDVTERKLDQREIVRLNEALQRRARELEITNRELEAFSYSVSHDLRAPLRAINGFALMLAEDHAGELSEEGKRLLGVVRGNAQRMGELIDDLLAFARIGRTAMNRVAVDMGALVGVVLSELGAPQVAALPPCAVGALPPAVGDPILLKQVWANLISNAVKYSARNPDARIEVVGERVEGECIYRIADNGAGFDMRYADKLFGVFQRLHRAEEFPGTGVGLAIVQRIVVRHGGRVWAEGKVNEGATFHFALPVEEVATHG